MRDRRRAERESGQTRPDYLTIIVEATERLLAQTPFHRLTIDQILAEAEVSRGTFYSYFSSKGEVVAELLRRVMLQMFGLLDPFLHSETGEDRRSALVAVLRESARLWSLHRPVFHATHDNWHSVPEIRVKWLDLVEQFTDAIAGHLGTSDSDGVLPAGPNVRQRSAALLWSSEHLLYLAGTDADANLPSEDDIVDTLTIMWEGTLLGPAMNP